MSKAQTQTANPAFTMTRKLRLLPGEKPDLAELEGWAGMVDVRIKGDRLFLKYDASQRQLGEIEQWLKAQGIQLASGWWQRWRRSWYRFTDDNVRGNARHTPHCCNKSPK